MLTLVTGMGVAQALGRHRAKDHLQPPAVQPPLRTLDPVGALDRTRGLRRAASVEVPLAGTCASTPDHAGSTPVSRSLSRICRASRELKVGFVSAKEASAAALGAGEGGAARRGTTCMAQRARSRHSAPAAAGCRPGGRAGRTRRFSPAVEHCRSTWTGSMFHAR